MKRLRSYITRLFGLVVVMFGILVPAFTTTASATSLQTVFVKQASLSPYSCGSDPNQWGFVITTKGLTASEIPLYISVEWSSTEPNFVPIYLSNAPVNGGSAHYFTDTTANPESYAFATPVNAEVMISTTWSGQFVLSHGACPSSQPPTLTITKTAGKTPITAGDSSTFTISSSANNLLSGDQVTLTDPLPVAPGVSYALDSTSNHVPGAGQTAWGSCAIDPSQVVACNYTASSDGSFSFANVVIDVSSTIATPRVTLDNMATISADGIVETSSASISIVSATPTLTITKTSGIPGSPSSSVIYSGQGSVFTVSGLGVVGWDYGVVTLSDPLPSGTGVGYALDSASNEPAAGQIAWDSCSLLSDSVTCTYTPPSAGVYDPSFANVVVDVTTADNALSQVLNNTATIDLGDISADASAAITVTGPNSQGEPSLSIIKAASPATINAPGSSTFTIYTSAKNLPPSGQVTLTDPLPSAQGVSYSLDSASNVPSGLEVAWTSCALSQSTPSTPATVHCYYSYTASSDSAAYDFAQVIVDVKADSTSPNQSILNTALISADGIDEIASASISIVSPTPTLTITKTSGIPDLLPSSIYSGQGSVFTMSDLGVVGWDYGVVTLSDPLPSGNGVSYALDSASNRPTGTELPWDSCSLLSDSVTCTYTPSPAGIYDPSFANVVVDVSTADTAPSQTLNNTATIDLGDISADSSASVVVTPQTYSPTPPTVIQPSVSLSDTLTKTAAYPSVVAGSTDSFAITGSFTGQVNSKVVLSDTMPQYVTVDGPVTVTGSSFPTGAGTPCSVTSETVVCIFQPPTGGLANPSIGTISVPVLIAANAPVGSVTNTATLTDTGDSLSSLQASAVVSVSAPIVASSSSAASVTPRASSAPTPSPSTIEVPSVHTGEPWSSAWWWRLVIISAGAGLFLLAPRKRRRSSKA